MLYFSLCSIKSLSVINNKIINVTDREFTDVPPTETEKRQTFSRTHVFSHEDTPVVEPPLHLNFALLRRIESCRELISRYKITTALLHRNGNRIGRKGRKVQGNPGTIFHYLRIRYRAINRAAELRASERASVPA